MNRFDKRMETIEKKSTALRKKRRERLYVLCSCGGLAACVCIVCGVFLFWSHSPNLPGEEMLKPDGTPAVTRTDSITDRTDFSGTTTTEQTTVPDGTDAPTLTEPDETPEKAEPESTTVRTWDTTAPTWDTTPQITDDDTSKSPPKPGGSTGSTYSNDIPSVNDTPEETEQTKPDIGATTDICYYWDGGVYVVRGTVDTLPDGCTPAGYTEPEDPSTADKYYYLHLPAGCAVWQSGNTLYIEKNKTYIRLQFHNPAS